MVVNTMTKNTFSKISYFVFSVMILILAEYGAKAQRQMENLDRGVIAVHNTNDSVYIGWRLSGTEPDEVAFNIYRQTGNEKPVRLNENPIKESTNYVDGKIDFTLDNSWFVKAILKNIEQVASKSFTLKANS